MSGGAMAEIEAVMTETYAVLESVKAWSRTVERAPAPNQGPLEAVRHLEKMEEFLAVLGPEGDLRQRMGRLDPEAAVPGNMEEVSLFREWLAITLQAIATIEADWKPAVRQLRADLDVAGFHVVAADGTRTWGQVKRVHRFRGRPSELAALNECALGDNPIGLVLIPRQNRAR